MNINKDLACEICGVTEPHSLFSCVDAVKTERDAALERAEAAEKEIARLLQITNQVEWGPFDGPCNDCGHHEAEGHTSACIYRILATPLPTEGD